MSKSSTRQCDIFTRGSKTTKPAKPAALLNPLSNSDANMVNITEVLDELKALRSDFGTKLDNINTKLTGMTNALTALEGKVTEIKQDVLTNTARVDEAETRIDQTERSMEEVESALEMATKRIAFLEAKTDDLENRGRRKNLRIFGLKEGAEGVQTLLTFVTDMLPQWLGLPPDRTFALERVHRTLADRKPNQNRAVLVRFLNFQEKEFVYRQARKSEIKHDGARITFAQDLSAETLRTQREFHPVIKLFAEMNAFRGFLYNPCRIRILYNKKICTFSTPQEAEEFYKTLPRQAAATEEPSE